MLKINKPNNLKTAIVGLLLAPVLLIAQNKSYSDFILSGQAKYGFIIPTADNVHLITGHVFGGELMYTHRTNGCKQWHQQHNYPEIGVGALFLNLGNPQQLGDLLGLYPYINFKLNKLESKVSFNFKLGVGLCYITKTFDRLNNSKNNAVGSNINGLVDLQFNTIIKLSSTWRLNIGLGLTHASNGATQIPNQGINMPLIDLGVGYLFGNKTCNYQKDTIPEFKKQWKLSVIGVCGVKQLGALSPKYMAYGVQLNLFRHSSHRNSFGGGIEIAYTDATIPILQADSINKPSAIQLIQVGAKLSYSYNIGKLSLPVDFGYYLLEQQYNGSFYQRLGLRYMVTEHIIANVTLLTHWFDADYFEWGAGYQF